MISAIRSRPILTACGILVGSLVLLELVSFGVFSRSRFGVSHHPAYAIANPVEAWWTENDAWGAWRRPNAIGEHLKPCFSVLYRSNEVGARDQSFAGLDPADYNILLLGDSLAEGFGVTEAERFDSRIEALPAVNVLNFGVSNNVGPVQYDLLYQEFRDRFEHDHVLIVIHESDFWDNDLSVTPLAEAERRYRPFYERIGPGRYEVRYLAPKPNGVVTMQDIRRPQNMADWVQTFFKDWFWSAGWLRLAKRQLWGEPAPNDYSGYFDPEPYQVEAVVYFLDRIIDQAGERPVTIFVAPNLPDFLRVAAGEAKPADGVLLRALESRAAANPKLFVIDGLSEMSRLTDDPASLYQVCDEHWNPRGHAVVGQILAQHFERLLDPNAWLMAQVSAHRDRPGR